jgi:hypothetical protein
MGMQQMKAYVVLKPCQNLKIKGKPNDWICLLFYPT